jgi:hypothetical protein
MQKSVDLGPILIQCQDYVKTFVLNHHCESRTCLWKLGFLIIYIIVVSRMIGKKILNFFDIIVKLHGFFQIKVVKNDLTCHFSSIAMLVSIIMHHFVKSNLTLTKHSHKKKQVFFIM